MQGRPFLYMVQNVVGQYASFASGYLGWGYTPNPLIHTPDGYMDMSIIEEMDAKNFGRNRTYGTPQNYVEDGAGILKALFYQYGYNYQVTLTILEQQLYLSDTEYGYYYTVLVRAGIDLKTFSHQGEKVVAQILEGDLKAMLTTNGDTVYEIPIDPAVAKTVIMSGLRLKQYANYLIQDPTDVGFTENGNHLVGLTVTSTEAKTQLGTRDTVRQKIDLNPAIYASKNWLLPPMPIDTNFTISVDFGVTVTLAPGVSPNPAVKYTLVARVFDENGNIVDFSGVGNPNLLFEIDGPTLLYNIRHQVTATKTIPLKKGYSVYLWDGINETNESGGEGAMAVYFHYDLTTSTGLDTDSNVVIQYDYQFPPTEALVLEPLYILQYLIGKISGGKYTASSAFLSSLSSLPQTPTSLPWSVYTSGDALRGLPNAVLKWSIDDAFQAINSTYNLGNGVVNNTYVVQPKKNWLTPTNDSDNIDLGPGSKYQCDLWTDVLFNTIKTGCENQTYDEALGDINGRYEFNMTQEYGTAVLGTNQELDLTTKARRDMYGAEYARINLDGKTTSDSSSDNDVFELAADPATIVIDGLGLRNPKKFVLDRRPNAFVTGLLDSETAFNVKLSPKHCLLRHGNYIRSVLHLMDDTEISLTHADKPVAMVTTYPGGMVVDERGVLRVGDLDDRIFLPYIFSDTTPSPEAAVQSNTIKKFSFSYNGGRIRVFGTSFKLGVQPVDYKVNAVQLLATPDNVMEDLVDIWD